MKHLKVYTIDGQLVTESRDVAEMIGREHGVIIRTIRGFIKHLTQDNFVVSDFFIESEYQDKTGRTLPCYLLTRRGCHVVANKMTGKKGILFTAAYVSRFDELERRTHLPNVLLYSEQIKATLLETSHEVVFLREEVNELKEKVDNQITLDHGEQRILQKLISIKVAEHAASSNHKRLLYAELHREIKDRFGVSSYKDVKRKELQTAIKYLESWIPKKVNRVENDRDEKAHSLTL